jgi:hypothetical protein
MVIEGNAVEQTQSGYFKQVNDLVTKRNARAWCIAFSGKDTKG